MFRSLVWTFFGLCSAIPAYAGLPISYSFEGHGNWSLDGGSLVPSHNVLVAKVPSDSSIEKAFFYASTSFDFGQPSITLEGVNYAGAAWTDLGTPGIAGLHAYRTDVTLQMQNAIDDGGDADFSFTVTTPGSSNHIDGAALVIVYSNAAEYLRQISLRDGFVAVGGTAFTHVIPPHFVYSGSDALLSLGIGFSVGNIAQRSLIDINNRRLSSTAGGWDDSDTDGGAAITIGGFGDNPLNPPDPFHIGSTRDPYDDELYNLALGNSVNPTPFLHAGDTQMTLWIENPGAHDDLVFFAGLNIIVPEPHAAVLVFTFAVLFGFFTLRRRAIQEG